MLLIFVVQEVGTREKSQPAKYNQLLRIEEELGEAAIYRGTAFRG